MPRIPIYQQQTSVNVSGASKQGRIDVSSGQKAMAQGLGNATDAFVRVQQDKDLVNASTAFTEFQKEYMARSQEFDQDPKNVSGENYSKGLENIYTDTASSYSEGLTPGAQRNLAKLTQSYSVSAQASSMKGEAAKKSQYRTAQTIKDIENKSELVNADPSSLEANAALFAGVVQLRTDISEDNKVKVIAESNKTFAMSAATGMLDDPNVPPEDVLKILDDGDYDEYLTVKDKSALRKVIESEITFQKRQAKMDKIELNAQAMSEFSGEYLAITMGIQDGSAGPREINDFINSWAPLEDARPALRSLTTKMPSQKVIQATSLMTRYHKGEITLDQARAEADQYIQDNQNDPGAKKYESIVKELYKEGSGPTKELTKNLRKQDIARALTDPTFHLDPKSPQVKEAAEEVYQEQVAALLENPNKAYQDLSDFSVDFSQRTGVVPKTVLNALVTAVTPEQKILAAHTVTKLIQGTVNPHLKKQIPSESVSLATELTEYVELGYSFEAAVDNQRKNREVDTTQKEMRADEARARFKSNGKTEEDYKGQLIEAINTFIDEGRGSVDYETWYGDNPMVKGDFAANYDDVYTTEYIKHGNSKAAQKTAFELTTRMYGVSDFGSSKDEFIKNNPEKHYGLAGLSPKQNAAWMEEQAIDDIKEATGHTVDAKNIHWNVYQARTNNGLPMYELMYEKDGVMQSLGQPWYPAPETSSVLNEMQRQEAQAKISGAKAADKARKKRIQTQAIYGAIPSTQSALPSYTTGK